MLNFNLFIISSFNMFFVCDIAVEGVSVSGKDESCRGPGCPCFEIGEDLVKEFGKDTCNSVSYCNMDAGTVINGITVGKCQLTGWMIAIIVLIVLGVLGIGICVLAFVVFKVTCCK